MDDINNAKRAAAQRPENRDASHGPQDELQIEIIGDVRGVEGLTDGHGENGVRHHPRDDHVRAHGTVVVFLLLGLADAVAGGLEAIAEVA